jgi:hypothetical protein
MIDLMSGTPKPMLQSSVLLKKKECLKLLNFRSEAIRGDFQLV